MGFKIDDDCEQVKNPVISYLKGQGNGFYKEISGFD